MNLQGIKNLTTEELAKVNVKFNGSVKNWLRENQTHFNGTPIISIFTQLCAWNNIDKAQILSKEVNNESIIDILNNSL